MREYRLGDQVHLDQLAATNFRSCEQVLLKLRPDLTVLVGENNGGNGVAPVPWTGFVGRCHAVACR